MNEVRSLQKINWNVELEQCKLVERAVCEFVNLHEDDSEMAKEEKAFVRTTTIAIEECF